MPTDVKMNTYKTNGIEFQKVGKLFRLSISCSGIYFENTYVFT